MKNIHIKSLNIETYRGIKNLNLEGFTGINIFTGDNNCGKTSVLELLRTLDNPVALYTWTNNLRTHSEKNSPSYYEGFIDLFNYEQTPKELVYKVITLDGEEHSIIGTLNFNHERLSTIKANKLLKTHKIPSEEKYIEADGIKFVIGTVNKGKSFQIFDFQELLDLWEWKEDVNPQIISPVIYISSTEHSKNTMFLDEILNKPLMYQEMLDILKDFDSDILSINKTITNNHSYYVILSKKYNKALPLNMYGDGMKKSILLMSAVVAAKDGILLIDEFETAIHTSAMNNIYAWILKTCKELNVQLFMTTHSKEALQKVLALNSVPELKDDISLFTLYRKDGKNIARKLSAERAIEADENFNQELR
ncbi:AAA family ATPase [uncultured Treponema sp.]|uniref:AAA family ATPase n=1 Tax=uncultured Treponema sp. TaxID=162155 RepID=UPI002621267F|nr:AAA family ATPase [uncultured Treponema sp.]